jgi:transcriptional regulator with XRE-family HTH domain
LNAAGYSQRAIGRLTGQSQSEVSEILNGREVVSVLLLERIADGLGCPRAWWRLNGTNEYGDVQRLSGAIALSRITVARREAEREQCPAVVDELQQTAALLVAQTRELEAFLSARDDDGEDL